LSLFLEITEEADIFLEPFLQITDVPGAGQYEQISLMQGQNLVACN